MMSELAADSVISKMETTAADNKTKKIAQGDGYHYNANTGQAVPLHLRLRS